MSTITTLNGSGVIATDRTTINTNFTNLNSDKIETSYLDTDTALTANSDTKIATQKAVKAYVLANVNPTGASWNEYAADVGATDAYAITLTGLTAYATGQTFKFKANTANTGACTLNVNGLGAKTIKRNVSTDMVTGDILANQIVVVVYDGTYMQLVSSILPVTIPTTAGGTGVSTSVSYKAGIASYDLSTASGTQTIAHSLGVTPKRIKLTVRHSTSTGGAIDYISDCDGTYDGTTNNCIFRWMRDDGNGTENGSSTSFGIKIYDVSTAKYQTGVITVDSTNITITWTKASTPTGTANILWEAFAF